LDVKRIKRYYFWFNNEGVKGGFKEPPICTDSGIGTGGCNRASLVNRKYLIATFQDEI
jgi:hypothetical protein